jgi:uncharacterized protein
MSKGRRSMTSAPLLSLTRGPGPHKGLIGYSLPGLAPLELIDVAAIAVFIGIATAVQGTMGFGFAILFAPLAVLVIEAQTAIATSILAGSVVSGAQYLEQPNRASLGSITPYVAGSIVGIPVGLSLLAAADETVLRLLVGIAVLLSALLVLARRGTVRSRRLERLPQMAGAGLAGGITFGAVSMNGPPVLLYLHWLGRESAEIRSRMFAFLAMSGAFGITLATVTGVIDRDVLLLVLAAVPAIAAGMLIGRWMRPRLSELVFIRMTLLVLCVSSVAGITGAIGALLS